MTCYSKAEPIQLTWSNNTITPDGRSVTSGVVISVGTPPQQLALTPVFILNNTVVNNIATCGSTSNSSCISTIGGGFDPIRSSTYAGATVNSWNGSKEDLADLYLNKGYVYFNDEVQVASQKIPSVPLLLQATGTQAYGGLGLGKDSSVLKELVSSNAIPSMSFSLYTGLYSASQAGMLILGGYAERFYQGAMHSHPDLSYCTACVNVTGLVYRSGNASVNLLANRNESWFEGIIEPYFPTIGLPDDVAYAFGNAIKGIEVPGLGLWNFAKGREPNGSLIVTLESGLVTTIPHDALFTPPGYTNGLAATEGANASKTYSLVQPWSVLSELSSMADPHANAGWFGIPYVAFVYIIRDYERQVVRLAAANMEAVIEGDSTAICSISSGDSSTSSSHVGAIVGGVIGGVIGLGVVGFTTWFLLRRSRRSKEGSKGITPTAGDVSFKSELHTSSTQPSRHELPLNQRVELAVDKTTQVEELSSDSSTQIEEMPTHEKDVRAELPA